MKNLTYIPFKKNRYFTGKLLTADDFEQEQRYFDDKRRLINRWVLGAGIVAGLEVIKVDDYNISVEMGLAIDDTGREILVDTPVIRRLSLIDGFEDAVREEGAESLYLCIEYDQISVEPVHNITNAGLHTQEEETFNKYRESYHLYVTDDVPGDTEDIGPSSGEAFHPETAVRERAEQIHQKTYRQGIYLARVELIKAGDFYMIEKIVPLTEIPYIYALPITRKIVHDLKEDLDSLRKMLQYRDHRSGAEMPLQPAGDDADEWQFAQGSVRIPVAAGSRPGYCLYSQEIAHGLGLGDVEVILHVRQGGYSYSGAEMIFPEEDKTAEAAVRVDFQMGTFVIGIRLLTEITDDAVEVGWTAIRKRSRNEFQPQEPRIYIQPALVNAKTREQVQLEAVCVNMEPANLRWRVISDAGGTVDRDGLYQAPNKPGVYEVSCEKEGRSEIRSSVFIVVRE